MVNVDDTPSTKPHNPKDTMVNDIVSPDYYYTPHYKKPFRLTSWKWLALALMNLILFGYLGVFDSPQPLQTQIMKEFKIGEDKYNLLYAFMAAPNIILPIFAGVLVDKMGARLSLIVFGTLVVLGQMIFGYGAQIMSFNMMLAGRVVYSLGADPLNIAQVVMVNKWFKGKELALAISLGSLMAGGGKAFNSAIIPIVYDIAQNIHVPLYFGGFICFLSLICAIVMVIWDKINDKREIQYNPSFGIHKEATENFKCSDMKKFKWIAWLLIINFGIFDGTIFSLRSYLNEFYQTSYRFDNQTAGKYISVHYMTMAISSPIMGFFIDKIGLRASITFWNSFLGILGFLYYILVPTSNQGLGPLIPLILFGLFLGIDDAAVFAGLPLVLDEKYLGTGYGLYFVFQNIFLTCLPLVTGSITEHFEKTDPVTGYFWASVFLGMFAVLATLESLWLLIEDKKNGSVLDKTVAKKDGEEDAEEHSTKPLLNDSIQL